MSRSSIGLDEPRPTLEQVCRRIDDISTLPQIALRVIEVANDPNSSARDLKEVLESDAALSTRVLRYINSSAYAMRSKITNLVHAISFLGISQIRNLALTASVSDLFREGGSIGPYSRVGLWRHLVAVGVGARMIAMRLGIAGFEDVFLAGLLHDIGIVLEDQHVHREFAAMVQTLDTAESLIEAERRHLGFEHTALAGEVLRRWNLPEVVIAVVRHHHYSPGYHGDRADLLWCVEIANLLCSIKGMSSVGVHLVRVSPAAIAGLALTRDDLQVLGSDFDRELELNQHLFRV